MSEILTGHEKYQDTWEIDIDVSIHSIQDAMFSRNPEKYGDFLSTIKNINLALKVMWIPQREIRVELFRCMYYAMRFIDDIIDGDTIPPLPLEQRKEIMDSILSGDINKIKNPLYKALAIRIWDLARQLKLEEEMSQASLDILQSMNFDLVRIIDTKDWVNGTRSEKELKWNFHTMDIVWTIRWTAIIFWIEIKNAIELLNDLWEACRIIYNLSDFISDIHEGMINIPREDIEKFWISPDDFERIKKEWFTLTQIPDSIKAWFHQEIKKYEAHMKIHKEKMSQWFEFTDWNTIKWQVLHAWRNIFMKNIVLVKTYIEDNQTHLNKILWQIS
jgi:hypothetical protein